MLSGNPASGFGPSRFDDGMTLWGFRQLGGYPRGRVRATVGLQFPL